MKTAVKEYIKSLVVKTLANMIKTCQTFILKTPKVRKLEQLLLHNIPQTCYSPRVR